MSETLPPFEPARAEEFELTVEVGNAATPEGVTRMTLSGAGRFTAEQAVDEKFMSAKPAAREQVSGELSRAEAENILRAATRFSWDRAFPPRPGIPDEAIVMWRLRVRDRQGLALRMWLRDAEKDPATAPVLAALRKGLARYAGERVYL